MSKRGFTLIILVVLLVTASAVADPFVRLIYATFDPLAGQPAVSTDLQSTEVPAVQNYYLVQFTGPI